MFRKKSKDADYIQCCNYVRTIVTAEDFWSAEENRSGMPSLQRIKAIIASECGAEQQWLKIVAIAEKITYKNENNQKLRESGIPFHAVQRVTNVFCGTKQYTLDEDIKTLYEAIIEADPRRSKGTFEENSHKLKVLAEAVSEPSKGYGKPLADHYENF